MTAEPENDPPLPEEAEEETQEQQGESLFAAPVMAEQERMIEAILFATADPVSVKELNARMPHGCDAAEALVHLRKRYEGRGVRLVKVGDDWAMRTAPDLGFLMQKETVETRKLSRAAIETLAIIAYGSGENAVAHWSGDLFALSVCIAYSGALTAVRGLKDISMIPAIPLAYIGAALVLWPFIEPGPPVAEQWHLFLGHGAFIAVATCFLTLGPRYISSPEVSLLILLESVLAPLLVWAIVGEDPGRWAMIGGAVVIGALLVSNAVALRRRRVV